MGVLVDNQIRKWANAGGITPFDYRNINPASIDLRWSGKRKVAIQRPDDSNEADWVEWTDYGIPFVKGNIYLVDTMEYLKIPGDMVGLLMLKSSTGRMGFIQAHIGLFDPGFEGSATLELIPMSPAPIKLYRGQKIVQLMLLSLESTPSALYSGRYQKQSVPTEYKSEVVTAEYIEEATPFTTEES